jgi:alginate O-acetyltransferase complex protein AlgI
MVFSSLIFLFAFLPLCLLLYYAIPRNSYRNVLLVAMSLFFYAWGEPKWISIMLLCTLVNYITGILAEKHRGKWQSKAALAASLIINLGALGFFKYAGFLMSNLNYLTGLSISFADIALPIGISFYTFQSMSYVIDVYRGEVEAQRSYWKLLLYVSMFHQLIAGPIVRYKDIAAEIENRKVTLDAFSAGVSRFVAGLGKKVILANTAGGLSALFLNIPAADMSVLGGWYGIILFAIQIYFDFSGYSDMAIGLGKMFGFTYKENFDYPYISKSATEFWRRWHISLGTFFRDYLYIPLGGNRHHHIRNLIIVWLLTGLWHGASWNFILWGLYYGLLIILEKLFLEKLLKKLPVVFNHFYLLLAVLVGWVFFYYTDLSRVAGLLGVLFGVNGNPLVNTELSITFLNNVIFLVIAVLACTPLAKILNQKINILATKHTKALTVYREGIIPLLNAGLLLVSVLHLVGQSYNPFLYFRF